MAKSTIDEWDETAVNNDEINSISLDGDVQTPAGVDDIVRELMSQVADFTGADTIASATATDLSTIPGQKVLISGTTTITGFGTIRAGWIKFVRFGGILTLTHNASSLILPGAANITTAAGDTAIVASLGSGNWECHNFTRAAAVPFQVLDEDDFTTDSAVLPPSQQSTKARIAAHGVVQQLNTTTGEVATGTTVLPNDDTIPQITEGDLFLTRTFTPTDATNTLKIEINCLLSTNNDGRWMTVALFQDSITDALACMPEFFPLSGGAWAISFTHTMTAGTTSEITFTVRAGTTDGTTTFNGSGGARLRGGSIASSIIVTEINA